MMIILLILILITIKIVVGINCGNQFDTIFCNQRNDLYLTIGPKVFIGFCDDPLPIKVKFLRKISKLNDNYKLISSIEDHQGHFYHFYEDQVIIEMASGTIGFKINQIFDQFEGKIKYSILLPSYVIGQKKFSNVVQLYTDVGLFTFVKKHMVNGHPFWTLPKVNNFSKLLLSLSEYNSGSNLSYQIKNLIAIQNGRLMTLVENQQLNLLLHRIDAEICSSILFNFNLINCIEAYMQINSSFLKGPIVKCDFEIKWSNLMNFYWMVIFFIILTSFTCFFIYLVEHFNLKIRYIFKKRKSKVFKYSQENLEAYVEARDRDTTSLNSGDELPRQIALIFTRFVVHMILKYIEIYFLKFERKNYPKYVHSWVEWVLKGSKNLIK